MCWKWFRKKPTLALPFPEEPPNLTATITTTSARGLLALWIQKYQPVDPDFWQTVDLQIVEGLAHPAETISELKQVKIQPPYANPGTLAHELAHISYSLLTDLEKANFALVAELVKTDPLVVLMVKEHPYALTNPVEFHAETFRYQGHALPTDLRPYYPRLI